MKNVVNIKKEKIDSKEKLQEDIAKMNSFGERTTGSKGHKNFVSWLENEIEWMGLIIHKKEYTFDRWQEKTASLYSEEEKIELASVYPYSGETNKEGVTGELTYVKKHNYKKAFGKIAVIEIDNAKSIPMPFIMNVVGAYPQDTKLTPSDGDLVISSTLWTPDLKKLKAAGIRAVIFVWKGVSKEKGKDQYLPFTSDYADIPAVWVDSIQGEKLIAAAKNKKKVSLILEAEKEKGASTESFYVEIEGKNPSEVILINSHTDGVNVVEENGAIAMLSMIRYLKEEKPEKTLIFAFVTGHFRLPVFKGTSQATSRWLMDHKELWDGKDGHKRAVAGLTVEHLGAMEWKDTKDGYQATGEIQSEYVYVNNTFMQKVWMHAIEHRKINRTVFLKGHNKFQFGESQPLFEEKIPVIGFIPMPDYLLTNSKTREIDKFNVDLMAEQLQSCLIALMLLDKSSSKEIGTGRNYTYFLGKN